MSALSQPAKKAVAKIAKSVVRREAEDKYVSVSGTQRFNSAITSSGECYPLIPQVAQGTDDCNRVGDKIRGKYLYITGMLQLDNSYLNTLGANTYIPPFTGRVMILSQKNVKVGNEVPTRIDVAHLLKDNVATGVARPYNSTIWDNVAPINKDLFRVHMDRKIKFNWVNHYYYAGGGNAIEALASGNDRTKYFRCRIKVPATLTFDNGNLDYPNNFAPFLCFGAVNDDGTSAYSIGAPFKVTWLSTLYFEDS